MTRLALILTPIAVLLLACDDPSPSATLRASIPAGRPNGPCAHVDDFTYYYCGPASNKDAVSLCATPQEPGAPHATICVERRGLGECDPIEIDGELYEPTQDNHPHACVISCADSSECPASMLCVADICAYPTF